MKFDSFYISYPNINSRWIVGLNVKGKAMVLLGSIIRTYLSDLEGWKNIFKEECNPLVVQWVKDPCCHCCGTGLSGIKNLVETAGTKVGEKNLKTKVSCQCEKKKKKKKQKQKNRK